MYRYKQLSVIFLTSILILGMGSFIGCKGPTGPTGSEGSQGEVGPIGPAGEDGSEMYAGQGAPTPGIGNEGDYYLNTNTGEYYGPKDSNGWGNPIIVLMGDDGQDGLDGEDGSQIYSGTGAPASSLGQEGDYYLDKSSFDLYGPQTASGWGTPVNIKGADGNANVTRYIFPGHDFQSSFTAQLSVTGIANEAEMRQNVWLAYIIDNNGRYFHVPGPVGPNVDLYGVRHRWNTFGNSVLIQIILREGTGDVFDQIEVVRIESGSTEDMTKQKSSIIPDNLDTHDYDAVAEYYNFGNTDSKLLDQQ